MGSFLRRVAANCGRFKPSTEKGARNRALVVQPNQALRVSIYNRVETQPSMHIPDGYLSPSTCAVMYGGAGVSWYAALRRLRRTLNARMVPLIAVFAAFSFLVMMFNLPLPGGTTGHALGVTIAAIVLGPSGAILALSLALAIQALFFGDGGVTTLGANCFNMAIMGSLVAYATYRLIAP